MADKSEYWKQRGEEIRRRKISKNDNFIGDVLGLIQHLWNSGDRLVKEMKELNTDEEEFLMRSSGLEKKEAEEAKKGTTTPPDKPTPKNLTEKKEKK